MKKTSLILALAVLAPAIHAAPAKTAAKPAPKPKAGSTAPKAKAPVQFGTLGWKPASAAQRSAAAASIKAQLEAFKHNDWEKAATYQSTGLRQMFGTTERFRTAIQTNYPQFANYGAVAFDKARAMGDRVEIAVRVTGKDGVKLRAMYLMIKERGIYRIEGVQGGASAPGQDPSDYV